MAQVAGAGRIMRYWIKLYTEIVRDPKMGRLTDRQFRTCINLFAVAGELDGSGRLPPLEDIAWLLRMSEQDLTADLEALAKVNILEQRDGVWFVRKWAERQAKPPSDDREAVKKRVNEHRQRKRNESVTPLQPGVTTPEAEAEAEADTDKEAEAEAEEPQPQAAASKALIAWGKTRPFARIDEMDGERLGEFIDLYGDEAVEQAIIYGNDHKKTPLLSLGYISSILTGWQMDGKLYGGQYVPVANRNGTPKPDLSNIRPDMSWMHGRQS